MKIIILGSTGNLGHTLVDHLRHRKIKGLTEIRGITRRGLDATKKNAASNLLPLYKIKKDDFIINCIGVIPQKPHDYNTLNLVNNSFARKLAFKCGQYGINLIQVSTDCVFSGKRGRYTEADKPDPVSAYGHSKLNGEFPSKSMVIRTSFIGQELSEKKFGLLDWFLHEIKTQPMGYINNYWNGLSTIQLSKIIGHTIERNLFSYGIFHVFSPHSISKYELLCAINREFKANKEPIPSFCKRNIDRTLSTNNQWFIENFEIPTIYQQIKELAEKYDQTKSVSAHNSL